MKPFVIILMLLFATPAIAGEMQHFNPDILGKPVGDCVPSLSSSTENAIKPIQVLANDIELESQSDVGKWCGQVIQISKRYKIDSELIKAITYMETTHGWYDAGGRLGRDQANLLT